MKVGTIGSGVIVTRMIDALRNVEGNEVVACYSRTQKRADEFSKQYNIPKTYTDLDEMLKDDEIDTIYVASPNSLHFEQSKKALLAKKHVINEKPFTASIKQAKELFDIAKENGVYIFEAITTHYLPNYDVVKKNLDKVGEIKFIQINFSQYSSKYAKYKNHENPNVFNPAFKGGALMDINVYNLHFVTGIFGKPLSSTYIANQGYNGIDTSGIVILQYPDFIATCIGAKDSSSTNSAIIQGDKGYIRVYNSSTGVCKDVLYSPPVGDLIGIKGFKDPTEHIGIEQAFNHMVYEVKNFMDVIDNKNDVLYKKMCDQTLLVVEILEQSLKQLA
ncbi:MAG: Gfo/Idh/MocA family oxidoreductase [Holdemanella sp.]|nr:Gfo/Idh/MocA family oxidoreductase [Holdemanella sp.]